MLLGWSIFFTAKEREPANLTTTRRFAAPRAGIDRGTWVPPHSSCGQPVHQPIEGALRRLKRLPGALLHDPSVLEHDDPVGVADRRETMRNHQRRARTRRVVQRLLH